MSPRRRKCSACGTWNQPYEVEACRKCDAPFNWRRIFGTKGFNRVAVYERRPGGEIQIMWWDRSGPHRETLKNLKGVPIFDQAKAERIGRKVSEAQAAARREAVNLDSALGLPKRRSVGELFARMHKDLAREWSPKYSTDQTRYRRFWENALGRDTGITDVGPADVARIVGTTASSKAWSRKTQNHYLNAVVEAWGYAEVHLKWIAAENNLAAVRRHRIPVDNEDIAYTGDHARAILAVLPDIDLRAAVAAELSYIGGRRLNAIKRLELSAYSIDTRILRSEDEKEASSLDFGVVTFPASTDKARKKGRAYVFGRAKARIEQLIATPLCQASGLLFPRGDDLDVAEATTLLFTDQKLRRALREAEQRANVPHVDGRAYHGFNRAFSTDVEDVLAASGQSGKSPEIILGRYRQEKPEAKARLALDLDNLRRGA